MKKFVNFLKKHSKKLAILAGASVVALGVGAAVSAWGPERPTFTIEHPANYVTFNSITNNPNYGDERMFLDAKPASNTNSGGYLDNNTVTNGQEILVRTYVHNNAAANLNLVAQNTNVRISLPTGTSKDMRIFSYISASNANPQQVYDHTNLNGAAPFNLSYVPGSAVAYTNAVPSGMKLSDNIVTTGAPIGYDKLDGNVPGCFQYTAIVTMKVKVNMPSPNFEMSKEVAKAGQPWVNDTEIQPGETVSYRIQFKNTGTTELKNVVVKDTLPQHMSYVPGTTLVYNGANPNGLKVSDNLTISGINIGDYAPGANAVVVFKAKASTNKDELCKAGVLRNVASVTPAGQTPKQDDANVTPPECEVLEPKFSCDALDVDRLNLKIGETANFTATGSASNGATITGYTFRVNGATVQDSASNKYAYQATQEGTYTISVIVKTDRGNTTESAACKKQLKVTKKDVPVKYECTALKAVALGNNKYRFTVTVKAEGNVSVNKYVYNFNDGSEEFSTTNASVDHQYAKAGEYNPTVRVVFNVGSEQKDARCTTKVVIPETPGKPEVPVTSIPNTGAGSVFASVLGASATAYGVYAWVESRRALKR